MATITSSGIGSGLDINSIITQLMTIESQPLTQLATKEASYQAKLSAFGTLQGAFASLQSAARALKSSTLFSSMTATPADTTVLAASANTAAQAAGYSVDVVALAKGQTIASQAFADITSDIAAADGKLKIELGTFSGGTFTADAAKTPVTIDIPQNASSLGEIRDAINNAGAGVTARVIDVGGNQYKLMITADDTGANRSLRITAMDDTGTPLAKDNTGLAKLYFDPAAASGTGKEFDVTVDAQDAHIKINSLDIYRSSNTISDAITGVTLKLAKEGTTSLTVAKNTDAVSSAIDAFVKAYNAANEQVRQLTAFNTETLQASVLTGDSGARALQTALRDMTSLSVSTQSSSIRRFSDIGITLQRDGSLQFNSAKLKSALEADPEAVEQLVTSGNAGTSGIATRMTSMLDGILSKENGIFTSRTEGIDRSIADIEKRREALQRRLVQIEARYRKQFSALDVAMSNMQQTSQYLQQQFAALSSSSSS